MKADHGSKKLSVLQQASRHVNEMAANVVGSTKTGQDQIEDKGQCDVTRAFGSWFLMLFFNKEFIVMLFIHIVFFFSNFHIKTPWTSLACLELSSKKKKWNHRFV